MAYTSHWERIRELGVGGQGTTYLVTDRPCRRASPSVFAALFVAASNVMHKKGPIRERDRAALAKIGERFLEWIASDQGREVPPLAVEKVLHKIGDKKENEKARTRLAIEIKALSAVSHPNLLSLRDANLEELSFVAEYYSGGTLAEQSRYKGDVLASLRGIRPLVEGVAELHKRGITHRDIKPANIFVADDGRLVLGDFGIVFFAEEDRTRVTDTYEKVGTTDYMPGWIRRERIDAVKPSFDVFALGKVVYEMIAGRKLHLWYLDDGEADLLRCFPHQVPDMQIVRRLLGRCVCESERDCLPDAPALLEEMDRAMHVLERHGQVVGEGVKRCCEVCASGTYLPIQELPDGVVVVPSGKSELRLFACSLCGHLQAFLLENGSVRSSWRDG